MSSATMKSKTKKPDSDYMNEVGKGSKGNSEIAGLSSKHKSKPMLPKKKKKTSFTDFLAGKKSKDKDSWK